jgi:glycerol-3-phosphate acyltransferase PlsY
MDELLVLLFLIGSYLLGAVPFGMVYARFLSGVDVRSVGSGNIGATNVLRAAGKSAAVLTLLSDGLKGAAPVLLANHVLAGDWPAVLCGAAAVLGHNFPVYLRFKGGKGVATSLGVVLGVSPLIGLACLVIWLASALLWKYSSLAALSAFAAYPLMTFGFLADRRPLGLLSVFLSGLIYLRHRENIKRLLAGSEPRIGRKT